MAQTLLKFSIASTDERLASQSGEIVFWEYLKAIRVNKLCEKYLPEPKSNKGYTPFYFIQPLRLMMHRGGRCLDYLHIVQSDKAMQEVLHNEFCSGNIAPADNTQGEWTAC